MQWVEWDKVAMTSGAFLPATDAAPYHIGGYDVTKPWPNPVTTTGLTAWPHNSISAILEHGGNPAYATPGDVGNVIYYPY